MFLLKSNWRKMKRAVWTRLEKRSAAPADMYMDLLHFERKTLSISVDEATDEVLHNPKEARGEFLNPLAEPLVESKCVELLEGYYTVLKDYSAAIADGYKEQLRKYVEEHNLRYTVTDNCKLELTVQGLLASMYSRLRTLVAANAEIKQSLNQLEVSVSRLPTALHEERNCISIATNLLEGIACLKTTNNGKVLSAAIEGCNVFPHAAVRQCVKDFYKFASDYPNLRHGHPGTPANKLRELKKDDALLAVALALGFGHYVFDNDSSVPVFRGDV
jgi:hypothetical protein